MKTIAKLTDRKLVSLRKQITLNSLFVSDYKNDLGIKPSVALDFFDGYVDYLFGIAKEDGVKDIYEVFDEYDNRDNLIAYRGSLA